MWREEPRFGHFSLCFIMKLTSKTEEGSLPWAEQYAWAENWMFCETKKSVS